jgi:D-methionine transport system ATP-binding protein
MIRIEHLTKTYATDGHDRCVLDDINLTIDDGDIFGIIGESGAGKSTLVRCINLLEHPTSGRVLIGDRDITSYTGKELITLRRGIGMIFQNFSLFQQRNVLSNVEFPLELQHEDKAKSHARASELLEMVGLGDKGSYYPSQLSGGQQQRVAIARALANSPKIMLCDEATSALDTMTTHSILELLKTINRDLGVTIVFITHSLAVAESICNRIAVIDAGHIVEQGATADVFKNPQAKVTRELLGMEGQVLA